LQGVDASGEVDVLTKDGSGLDVECDSDSVAGASATTAGASTAIAFSTVRARGGKTLRAPRVRNDTSASLEGSQGSGVTPSQVNSAEGSTVASGKLFSETTIGRSVFGDDLDETIGEGLDGGGEGGVGGRVRGICAWGDAGDELSEERLGDGGDGDGASLVPREEGKVELLSSSEGGQIPGVTTLVRVLLVTTSSDSRGGWNTRVEIIGGSERVNIDLVVGKSFVRAGLESDSSATSFGIESMDSSKNSVGINAGASSTGVSSDEVSIPVRLQEAKRVGSLGSIAANQASLTKGSSEGSTFTEGAVLNGGSKE